MAGKFVCPKCGSDNIQSCQVIYQNGTVSHSYTSTNGNDTVNTSGVESTNLAQSVALPPKKDEPYMGVLGCLGVAVVFYWWGWSIGSIIGVLAAVGNAIAIKEAMEYNEKQWPKEYKAWQRSYLCHRCGHYFQLD